MAAKLHERASGENLVHSRFIDMREKPKRLSSPITGYENVPLVSLEKAVEPVSHFFDFIHQYVWIARQYCRNPKDGLTQDESASIYLYTMEFEPGPSLYVLLNGILRSERRRNIRQWFLFLKLFFTALNKLPSHRCKVWRGVRGVDLSPLYTVGDEIVWWGVTSCTQNLNVLENDQFVGKDGVRTIFSIDCKNCKKIALHSYYQNKEEEVIVMPDTYFRIKDNVNPSPGLHMIDMEEISTPINHNVISPVITKVPELHQSSRDNLYSINNVKKNAPPVIMSNPNISSGTMHTSAAQPPRTAYIKPVVKKSQTVPSTYNATLYNKPQDKCSWKAMLILIVFVLLMILPVDTLIVGQINKNNCPIQTWIPQWMTVFGAVGTGCFGLIIIVNILTMIFCPNDNLRNREKYFGVGVICLLLFFYLAWLVMGSLWILPVYANVQFNNTASSNYCQQDFYKFSFGMLILQYALIVLLIFLGGPCILIYTKCCTRC